MPPFAVTAHVAFRGAAIDQVLQVRELEVGCVVRQVDRRLPAGGERQHRRELLARQNAPNRPGRHDHRRRDDATSGLRRSLQIAGRHARRIVLHRQRNRLAREALERLHDHLRRCLLRQRVADGAGHDRDAETLAHEPRFAMRRPDMFRDQGELVVERGVVDARRRSSGCPRRAAARAAGSPGAARSLHPPRRGRNRRVPIHAHSECPRRDRDVLRPDDERHRDALQARRAVGQKLLGRRRGQSADVDAGDPRPAGEPAGRAREEQADSDQDDHQQAEAAEPGPGTNARSRART